MPSLRTTLQPLLLLAVLSATLLISACGAPFIANTDVEDNALNRRIVDFCELYRKAVERQDLATLVSLASPAYYENGGNVDASDDLDYAGLREYLSGKFLESKNLRYEIRYRRITLNDDIIFVDYTYSGSFREEKWRSTVEENRLELVPDSDSFRIVAGM